MAGEPLGDAVEQAGVDRLAHQAAVGVHAGASRVAPQDVGEVVDPVGLRAAGDQLGDPVRVGRVGLEEDQTP
ncbi:hypothetical protein ACWFRJ_09225 [Streptomyces sp. NPDC055239]